MFRDDVSTPPLNGAAKTAALLYSTCHNARNSSKNNGASSC